METIGVVFGFFASFVFTYSWYVGKREETTTVLTQGGQILSLGAHRSALRDDIVEEHVEDDDGQMFKHRRLHCCAIFLSSFCTMDFQQYFWYGQCACAHRARAWAHAS
jgi:hypothetical protein